MDLLKKYCIIFFALSIIFPSAVSLNHIYFHEAQEVCAEAGQPHYHKKNIDCELCNLQYNSHFTFSPQDSKLVQPELINERLFNYYYFLSEYQKLPFGRRGPPAV